MLPAHDELKHYAECTGAELAPRQQSLIARTIKGMTAEEADAWVALLQAAEKVGGEYDYSRGNDDDDDTQAELLISEALAPNGNAVYDDAGHFLNCPYCGTPVRPITHPNDDPRYMNGMKPVDGPGCEYCGQSALDGTDDDARPDQPIVRA